ncbi:MAG: Mur ligase family protein [Gemmatimonadota bacterium]
MGVQPGLERMQALLAEVGNPHLHIPSFHVGGTNGKGSTAAILAAVLQAGGYRVGLHTSPHLVDLTERYLVGGVPVTPDALTAAASTLRPAVDRLLPTFFEATVALAFQVFRQEGVDGMVVEVGLGGRLDATNVLTPLAAGVTRIGVDHEEFLGSSTESIALEKAGIAKPGVPFLTTEPDVLLRGVLEKEARRRGAQVLPVPPLGSLLHDPHMATTELKGVGNTTAPRRTSTPGESLVPALALAGAHQVENARLALALLDAGAPHFRVSAEDRRTGLVGVRWPGRLDLRVVGGRPWLFDVAHNPQGAESLHRELTAGPLGRELIGPRVLVVGILGDKPWQRMLEQLAPIVDVVHLVDPPSAPEERRWNGEAVWSWVKEQPWGGKAKSGVGPLAPLLKELASHPGQGSVVVTGSTHTVGDAFQVLGLRPFSPHSGLLQRPDSG